VALTVTFQQLQDWAKQRAHMENGGPLSDQEWKDLVNVGIRGLYRILTQAFGSDYFGTSVIIPTVANQETVNVPADFFKLVSLWWDDGTGVKKRILRATEADLENQLLGQGWGIWLGRTVADVGVKYSLRAGAIRLVPTPTTVYQLRLNYIKAPVTLSAPGETLDGYGGFEEYVWRSAAADALAKEESDASYELRRMAEIEAEIKETAERDQSEPMTIQSVTGWMGE